MREPTANRSDLARVDRGAVALAGLSVGDAFGERFFVEAAVAEQWIAERIVPAAPWPYTDDTEMALSVVAVLRRFGRIDQEALAEAFVARYDPSRGYGPAMHRLIRQLADGEPWTTATRSSFSGQGSYGNGAAMRAAPVGAYFADDIQAVVQEARRSAEVTHAHSEGIAGAVAVAVAAALAWRARAADRRPHRSDFLDEILPHVPVGEVHSRIRRARDLSDRAPVTTVVALLGNGTGLSAQDTVPFSLWCSASHLDCYEDALWQAVSGLGDRDTTSAIVGGIVACYVGESGISAAWLQAREPLPQVGDSRYTGRSHHEDRSP